MATNLELKREQTQWLFDLLRLKKVNEGIVVKELDILIERAKAPMEKEDIASVEKSIAVLYP